jgi:hypothetical protein
VTELGTAIFYLDSSRSSFVENIQIGNKGSDTILTCVEFVNFVRMAMYFVDMLLDIFP